MSPRRRIFIGLACAVTLLTLALWLGYRWRRAQPAAEAPTPQAATASTVSPVPAREIPRAASEVSAPQVALAKLPPAATSTSAPIAAIATPPTAPATPAPSAPTQQPATSPEAPTRSELQATARMYAAHASLRVPEVADPDSATNRATLQTMILKALEHSKPGQPKN